MKVKISSVLILFTLLFSCGVKKKADVKEYLFVETNQHQQLTLYHYNHFLDLGGVNCDFLNHIEDNSKSYIDLMTQLEKKTWDYDFISVEYIDECMNDSIFKEYQKLNNLVFGKKVKSIRFEGEILVIDFRK